VRQTGAGHVQEAARVRRPGVVRLHYPSGPHRKVRRVMVGREQHKNQLCSVRLACETS
jgi:hypothetical protein